MSWLGNNGEGVWILGLARLGEPIRWPTEQINGFELKYNNKHWIDILLKLGNQPKLNIF